MIAILLLADQLITYSSSWKMRFSLVQVKAPSFWERISLIPLLFPPWISDTCKPHPNTKWEYQQRYIQNSVKHLRWSVLWKVTGFQWLTIYCKKPHLSYLIGFWICLWSSPYTVMNNRHRTDQLSFKILSAILNSGFLQISSS